MALVRLCPGYRSMGPMLTAPMVGEMTTKNCVSQCQHAITLRAILRRTEIKAHSPLYSTKIGRVLSKNAGDASMAVAIPALIAYFMSCCFMRAPNAHSDCFTRPMNVACRVPKAAGSSDYSSPLLLGVAIGKSCRARGEGRGQEDASLLVRVTPVA